MKDLRGKRATVWGLGLFGGGVAAARFLHEQGAEVTVIDTKPAAALESSVRALAGLGLRYRLGIPHEEEDLLGAELVVASPAIPPRNPWLARLEAAGVLVTSEIALALAQVRVPYAAVTGSKGKTTTASLLGRMLAGDGRRVAVAGNNERPLLDALRQEPELLVLELSSFMATAIERARRQGAVFPRPGVQVFTRLSPEHLDWHGTQEHYYGAKLSLLELEPGAVVIPAGASELEERAGSRGPLRVRCDAAPREAGELGVRDGWCVRRAGREDEPVFPLEALSLLGAHNRENALLAAAGALALGATPAGIEAGARAFRPLEHRLETVAERGGLRFIDDSTATTPEAAIAALRAAPKPVVLLAGGSDKGACYGELGAVAAQEAAATVCLGVVGERIAQAVEAAGGRAVRVSGGFEEAFQAGLERCGAAGSLLLSPAAASYDMFANFKARGRRFRELAQAASA
ncbi:MAG: UDP-N-acetylmuramoyl-L-alanine--D-glutamate ligase [Planctomycetota bacterium]